MLECCLQINLAAKITWVESLMCSSIILWYIDQQLRDSKIQAVNSLLSKRFCACSSTRKLGQEQNNNKWRGRGRGRGKKEMLARNTHDFEKLHPPTNVASDWCSAGSVDYLALETSIKQDMLCLHASQIWSHLICGCRLQMVWTGIYLNQVCAKENEIAVFKV